MQPRCVTVSLILVVLLATSALAGDYSAVEVGTTGKYLKNSALHQDKHYLKNDDDLLARVCAVIGDMDTLLASLHALPPELQASALVEQPAHSELLKLIQLGLENSPELKPFRSQIGVLAAKTRQAGAMKDPMISFMLMNFPAPQLPLDDTPMTQISLGASQTFESYGKRKLRRSIAQMEEELTEYSLAQRELELVGTITDEYFTIAGLTARKRVLEENIQLLTLLVELAERKYALGNVPQAQVLSAQVSLTGLEERLLDLTMMISKQKEMLNGALGRPEDADLDSFTFTLGYPVPGLIEESGDNLSQAAFDLRPDYQRLLAMQQQQGLMLELSERGYRPDYTLSLSYGGRWGKRDFISAGIMFPLFTHKEEKQDAAVQESAAMLDVTTDKIAVLENSLATRIEMLLIEATRLHDTSALYRDALVPQARLALDSSIATFAANKLDLSDLVKAQQQLLTLELELEQQYIDYLAVLSELQVITAGAFDPAPYLASIAAPGPEDVQSTLLLEPIPAEFQDDDIEPGSFIEGLDLPSGESAAEEVPSEPDASGEGASGTSDPGDGGFYQPFEPKDGENDG